MSANPHDNLIYDWNAEGQAPAPIQFDDETLRDGLQSPSARDPELEEKLELVHLMDGLGIDTANVGLPGASEKAREHIMALCRAMADLSITPNVACRTLISDIAPAAEVQQATGSPVEVCTFIGSSRIRQFTEKWELDKMLQLSRDAIEFCVQENMACMFVTEDTTRAHPETVRALYTTAIEAGASRICICDTCGHATPTGVKAVVSFVKDLAAELGAPVGIDWHGHNDRGLGLINALAAIEAGATRIHGTALGIGERTGNTQMDLLLANLALLGWINRDLSTLGDYVSAASKALNVEIPRGYPAFGQDAFETSTGVHASAVIKALRMNDTWLANRVYSGVPADLFGLEQVIAVGPMSGRSNVIWFLEKRGIDPTEERVERVLAVAKTTPRQLTAEETLAAAEGQAPASS